MAREGEITAPKLMRRDRAEVETTIDTSSFNGRGSKSGPDITIFWNSNGTDSGAFCHEPEPARLLELARALGRFAAYRAIEQSKLRLSSEVLLVETSSQTTDASVSV